MCRQGLYYVNTMCTVCSNTSYYNGSVCVCNASAGFYPSINGTCRSCPVNSSWNGQDCACNQGLLNISGTCAACPGNSTWNGSVCNCNTGFNTIGNPPTHNCQKPSCPANSALSPSGSCTCNDGFYSNPTNTLCSACNSSCLKCSSPSVCT